MVPREADSSVLTGLRQQSYEAQTMPSTPSQSKGKQDGFLGKRMDASRQFTFFKKQGTHENARNQSMSPYLHNKNFSIDYRDASPQYLKRSKHSLGRSLAPKLFAPLESIHSNSQL